MRFLVLATCALLCACNSVEKDDASNFFLKGNIQMNEKNYPIAIRYYDEALQKYPDFADAQLNKGLALLQMDQAEAAYQALTAAIAIDDALFPAFLARAEVASRLGFWNEAAQDLDKISQQYADFSQYHLVMGNVFVGKNDNSAALGAYDRALLLNQNNVEALVNRGAIYFGQKNYKLAGDDFEKAAKLSPMQVEALNNLGLLSSRQQEWQTALTYFDRALSVNAVDPFTLNNKGFVLINLGQFDEAATLINRSLGNSPDNGYALRNLGLLYLKQNKLSESIKSFDKALDLAQSVESLHGYAGEAYLKNKAKEKACSIWQTGIVLKDSLAQANFDQYCKK